MKKVRSDNADILKLQDVVADALAPLERSAIPRGVSVEGVTLVLGKINQVAHGLGRPRGYIVVRQDAGAIVWETSSAFPERFINLNSSADVKVSLWVY